MGSYAEPESHADADAKRWFDPMNDLLTRV